ncbi:MAG: DUF11 domain-containing protein [bacterium]
MNSRFSIWGKKKWVSAGFVALSLVCTASSHAATLAYPGSAPCDTTLQACINGANSGDEIQIATNNLINESIISTNSITLTAAPGFQPQIGSGNINNPQTLFFNDNQAVSINLDHINFNGASLEFDFSHPHLGVDQVTVTNCTLTNNASTNQAGIFIDATVDNNVLIQGNKIITSPKGITYNYRLSNPGNSTITIIANEITSADPAINSLGVETNGAGVGNAQINIYNNIFHSLAKLPSGPPAAIVIGYSNIIGSPNAVTTVANIVNNTIDNIYHLGVATYSSFGTDQTTINLYNNAITNTPEGVVFPSAATPQLIINNDNNFFFNSNEFFGGYSPGPHTVLSSANSDPLYVDPAADDYRLQANSPLINKGDNNPPDGLPSTDFEGKNRIINGIVDIGAIEYGQGVADLAITEVAFPDAVEVGQDITYVLTVTNNGPEAALNVVLTDNLPSQVAFVNALSNQGTCSGAPQLSCSLGILAKGESALVTVIVTASANGSVSNTVNVRSDDFDPNTANNTASSSTTVNAAGTNNGGSNSVSGGGGCSLNPSVKDGNLLQLGVFFFPLALLFRQKRKASL